MKSFSKRGHRCPHCDGTGRVFVHMDDQVQPVYRRPIKEWNERMSHSCGMCGGDGWIDPGEDWDAYTQWTCANEKSCEDMAKR